MFHLHAIEADHDLKRKRFGPLIAQFHNSIGEETVGRDMHTQRTQMAMRDSDDIEQVRPYEWFTTRQSHGIHAGQLPIDRFDLVGGEIPFPGHLPRVAHDATGITAKGDGVRQHAGPNRTARAILDRIRKETGCSANRIDPSHI
jgi:hypothetical protein